MGSQPTPKKALSGLASTGPTTFLVLIFVGVVGLVTRTALDSLELQARAQASESNRTIVHMASSGLDRWATERRRDLRNVAERPELVSLIRTLLVVDRTVEALDIHPAQATIRKLMEPWLRIFGDEGMFIISPDGTSVGSMRRANLGQKNLIQVRHPGRLRRVFGGEFQFIPAIVSDVPLARGAGEATQASATMFMVAPISDGGRTIAALALRVNPYGVFAKTLATDRIGAASETYAIDERGTMISPSHHQDRVYRLGLLDPAVPVMGNLAVRDPGADLERGEKALPGPRPLTRAARALLQRGTGFDSDGYRDFRGVPVLGAWTWNRALGIGVVTETDEVAALSGFETTRLMVIGMVGGIALLALLIGVVMIRSRRHLRKALELANSQLEAHVSERTLQLTEANIKLEKQTDALKRARQHAEAANESKSAFFASMSHELRTPLNAVIGFSKRLLRSRKEIPTQRQRDGLETIERCGQTLLHLVNELLDLSSLEAGGIQLERREMNLAVLVHDVVATLEPLAEEKALSLIFETHAQPVALRADPRRCQQIVTNLISNAIKYTDEGEVRVSIEADEDAVIFRCVDTGLGIGDADLERVFSPYARIAGRLGRRGTGLGLPITRELAELHGGTVTLESELGVGSTFTVWLPRHPVAPAPETAEAGDGASEAA